MSLSSLLSKIRLWLRERTRPWHLIDIRCPQNGYSGGFVDRSDAVLYAAFAVLRDFMELEYPGCIDWNHGDLADAHHEMRMLHEWWMHGRQVAWQRWDTEYGKTPTTDAAVYTLAELEETDNVMLQRLIRIRGVLWT